MPRRLARAIFGLLLVVISLAVPASADDPVIAPIRGKITPSREADGVSWYDLRNLTIEGQGWDDTAAPYDRLPAKAEGVVRDPVWSLSRHSAGICARFVCDAGAMQAHWKLTSDRLAMAHMPSTGVSGLDLYVRDDSGAWQWLETPEPKTVENTEKLFSGVESKSREFLLYLPLYNGVSLVEIGIPTGAKIEEAPARSEKPIVFYGTSITHGACASRPGMTHPAILGRRFDRPVINLGFSGNGTMDASMGDLLNELDVAVYCIDCLPNMMGPTVAERAEPLVRQIRAVHADTPIVLVEDRTYSNSYFFPDKQQRHADSRAALRAAFDKLKAEGDENLYYLEGDKLLLTTDSTVDSSHPTDLGFVEQANAFEEVLRPILAR